MARSSFSPIAQPQGQRPVVEIRSPMVRSADLPAPPSNPFADGIGELQQALVDREKQRQRNLQTPNPADPWADMRQETATFGGRLRGFFGLGR